MLALVLEQQLGRARARSRRAGARPRRPTRAGARARAARSSCSTSERARCAARPAPPRRARARARRRRRSDHAPRRRALTASPSRTAAARRLPPREHVHHRQVLGLLGGDLGRPTRRWSCCGQRPQRLQVGAHQALLEVAAKCSASSSLRRRGKVRAYSSAARPAGGSPPSSRISRRGRARGPPRGRGCARVARASPRSTSPIAAHAAIAACSSARIELSSAAPEPASGPLAGGRVAAAAARRARRAAAPPSAARW